VDIGAQRTDATALPPLPMARQPVMIPVGAYAELGGHRAKKNERTWGVVTISNLAAPLAD
jgi:hypothetical protein